MTTLLVTVLFFGLALLAMSIGVIFGREPIRGSCGGVAGRCALCSGTNCRKRGASGAPSHEETT